MKEIVVVAMVKDEEILIESAVRYWLSFADRVILFDHYSKDGTMAILQCLIAEFGERLVLFNPYLSIGIEKKQELVTNAMTEFAFSEYGADLVIPLDTDEYPYLSQGGSLRDFFCALPQNSCYKVFWMPFAPPENDQIDASVFAPLAFTRKKKVPMPHWEKTIITRECYERFHPKLTKGNHNFFNDGENPLPPRENLTPQLFYAHYPCRGKTHYIIKNLQGWISAYSNIAWQPGVSIHYQLACEHIVKTNGKVDQDLLDWYAMSSNGLTGETIEEIKDLMEVVDPREIFSEIQIKFTPNHITKKDPIILLFESTIMITEQYRNNCMVEQKVGELQAELAETKAVLNEKQNELNSVFTSKSWKLTKPLRDCMARFHQK